MPADFRVLELGMGMGGGLRCVRPGMSTILAVLSLAAALAHHTVAANLRRFSQMASCIGGVLMVLAGGYPIWYGRWELACMTVGSKATE